MLTNVVAEPVCVVIADSAITEDEARHHLGDFLPLSVTRWEERLYLAAIHALRPRVVVVLARDEARAYDSAQLVACLLTRFRPTVISVATSGSASEAPSFVLQQLGPGTSARIVAPSDLRMS